MRRIKYKQTQYEVKEKTPYLHKKRKVKRRTFDRKWQGLEISLNGLISSARTGIFEDGKRSVRFERVRN